MAKKTTAAASSTAAAPTPAVDASGKPHDAPSLADALAAGKKRGNKPLRMYAVEENPVEEGGEVTTHLVKATNKAKAIMHVASTILTAREATTDDIYNAGKSGTAVGDASNVKVR